MPARTVVIEDLWKFSGERHELLTPGAYTQLTGRAGRRGTDEIGYAVVLLQQQVPFERVAGLASTRTYELRSSFRPSYNMAVNLIRNYSPEEARHLLNSSFAQFLADRGVVSLERQLERDRAFVEGYARSMACDRGDFAEYWALRERAKQVREDARRSRVRDTEERTKEALGRLRPGDVILMPGGRRRGLAVVTSTRDGRPTVLTDERRVVRTAAADFDSPPGAVAKIELPRSGSARSARFRRDAAGALAALRIERRAPRREGSAHADRGTEAKAAELERAAAAHPCHACPDRKQHERWAERGSKLTREIASLDRRIRRGTETLSRRFDRVVAVLRDLGYVKGFSLTENGERLRRIYGEGDLLLTEALSEGLLGGLSPSELGGLVSTLVYEGRERQPQRAELPTQALQQRYRRLEDVYRDIRRAEEAHQVELTRDLDPGFVATIFRWAEGAPLDDVLLESAMAPGDFVRNAKQLLDLLRQVEDVADGAVADAAADARTRIRRSVVAYTGLEAQGPVDDEDEPEP
jgi:ATP-dependent RNA helicase HelY